MLFGKTTEHIDTIKRVLKNVFSIKKLKELKYCLGIQIHRDRSRKLISINQRAYIKRLAEKFGMENCKDVHTPADSNSKLVKPTQKEAIGVKFPYRGLVGALRYVATCTRPDIAHAVDEVAKFCENMTSHTGLQLRRILKYLKTTQDIGIVFDSTSNGKLIGFADANWAIY